MKWTPDDLRHMRRAIVLAENGARTVAPNPLVGCVITSEAGEVIGEGWHEKPGNDHAEVKALQSVSDSNRSMLPMSTWYVTLEPCNHMGRTPPCAALIESVRPRRLVIACSDTNPNVQGGGAGRLRQAGISVETGCLQNEVQWQNRRFFWNALHQRPWVVLKWAQCQNGYLDPRSSEERTPGAGSFALTGPEARAITHDWRSKEQAIAIGSNTALVDNPRLDVRVIDAPSPRIILLDPSGELPASHPLFKNAQNLIHVVGSGHAAHGDFGCTWDIHQGIDNLLTKLYGEFGVMSVLIEGGAAVLSAFLDADRWNEIKTWTSAKQYHSGLKAPELPQTLLAPVYESNTEGMSGSDQWNWFIHPRVSKQ